MDFWIEQAWAQAVSSPANNPNAGLMNLLVVAMLFFAFYFLIMRPHNKRAKEHKQMVDSLAKGDEVITQGGLLGRIINLGTDFLVLEVAKETEVKVQRQAIVLVVPKGTMKNTL